MKEVRLINANALKFKNLAEVNGRLTYVLTAEEIDNAPTVTLPIMLDNKYDEVILAHERIAYERGVADGYAEAIEEMPRGEWIMNKTSVRGRNYTCTACEKVSRNKFHFCPNCGARMEIGRNE